MYERRVGSREEGQAEPIETPATRGRQGRLTRGLTREVGAAPAPADAGGPWSGFRAGRWQRHIDLRDFLRCNLTPYLGAPDFLAGPTPHPRALRRQTAANGTHGREAEWPAAPAAGEGPDLAAAIDATCTPEILACRRHGLLTGLPDAPARGGLAGDYRRVVLYGLDRLIRDKRHEKTELDHAGAEEETLRLREELAAQRRALEALGERAARSGCDLAAPAGDAREAVRWLTFAYLGAAEERPDAALPLGRICGFLDIYLARDLAAGRLDEAGAQALVDELMITLRELCERSAAGAAVVLGGLDAEGRPLVTRTSYRLLQSLRNLGPASGPAATLLWSPALPAPFKRFCADTALATGGLQVANDELMRPVWGDDYALAGDGAALKLGKQLPCLTGSANLPKALLYALNGGRDELTGEQVGPAGTVYAGERLDHDAVCERLETTLDWLARVHGEAASILHRAHDRYAYARLAMALHDRDVFRTQVYGLAGLAELADSLAAIKYADARPRRARDSGLILGLEVAGDPPVFGTNDNRVDGIAVELLHSFAALLRGQPAYRDAEPACAVAPLPLPPHAARTGAAQTQAARPPAACTHAACSHGTRTHAAAVAADALASLAKLSYAEAPAGIAGRLALPAGALGATPDARAAGLIALLDDFVARGGHRIGLALTEAG